jgi:predicted enzyme related to lactoylglutathione lyase
MDLSGYMIRDTPRSIAFYRDALGLEPASVYPDDRMAEYHFADGMTFGLFGGGAGVGIPFQPGNGILFAVDDLDTRVTAPKRRGIPVLIEREMPLFFMAMMTDTEGNGIFSHERKSAARA